MEILVCAALLFAFSWGARAADDARLSAPVPCLDRLIAKQEAALADCQNRAGRVVSDRGFLVWHRPREEDLHGFLRARRIGDLPDGATAYFLIDNGGGTGLFSQIITARRDGGRLRKTLQIDGGDRCSGGIEDARIKDGHLVVRRVMTTEQFAGRLAAIAGVKSADQSDFAHFGRDDWPYCAICCVADREVAYDVSGNEKHGGDLRLDLEKLRGQADANDAARCLLHALEPRARRAGDFLALRGDRDARALARKVRENCAQ